MAAFILREMVFVVLLLSKPKITQYIKVPISRLLSFLSSLVGSWRQL